MQEGGEERLDVRDGANRLLWFLSGVLFWTGRKLLMGVYFLAVCV